MDTKVYFRRGNGRDNHKSLKEYTYSDDGTQVTYHKQLFGRRHYLMQRKAMLQKQHQRQSNFSHKNSMLSLYNTCLHFVANHLFLVESFNGLPSLIGEEIFATAVRCGVLSSRSDEKLLKKIRLFTDTYGPEMFQKLSMQNQGRFIAQYLDNLSIILPFLHSIFLSKCGISDEHDILFQLGKLPHLKSLSLTSNHISDTGVKNLMQNQRRAKKGLSNLAILNISKNYDCSMLAMEYMICLPAIRVVSITVPKKQAKFPSIKFARHCKTYAGHHEILAQNCGEDIVLGWGSKLVTRWIKDFRTAESERTERHEQNDKRLPFYRREKPSDKKAKKSEPELGAYITLVLCTCCNTEVMKKPDCADSSMKKRRLGDFSDPKPKKVKLIPKSFVPSVLDEESTLLQQYEL